MTNREKTRIIHLREQGMGIFEISKRLDLSVNTVKSFCQRKGIKPKNKRISTDKCKYCGNEIILTPYKRRREFCNDTCRMLWWAKKRKDKPNQLGRDHTCAFCGQDFKSHQRRKYCSHVCYIKARFGGSNEN